MNIEQEQTFPAHQHLVSRPLSTFPEPTSGFAYEHCAAYTAVLWSVDLFPRAEATTFVSWLA
jgi:hypothetical protein